MSDSHIQTPDWLRKMETILEELNEGVVIVDDELRIIFANDALLRLGQYTSEELQGCSPDAIFPPEDIPYIMRQHESGHRYGRNRSEFHLPRKDGRKVPVIFSGRSIQAPDGQRCVLITVTDISEQKRVEEQLRESNALLEERQREIDAELSTAARVQESLAPRSVVWKDLAVEAHYGPAHTIGGDFGIVVPRGDDLLNVIVCDVSGHGVSSALIANRIYSETLHQLERTCDPADLLRQLHEFVLNRIGQDGFYFTMAAARFSSRGRHMSFASAGHPPAIHLSKGSARLLDPRIGILGSIAETAEAESAEDFELAPGDRLILYTDGLVEVFNSLDEMLGVERLQRLILECAELPIQELKHTILNGVKAWSAGPLCDDVSLVIVEVR